MNDNKRGRPKKYVFWDDWQAWLIKEWCPFKYNELSHMKTDVSWIKKLLIGFIIADITILAGALFILFSLLRS